MEFGIAQGIRQTRLRIPYVFSWSHIHPQGTHIGHTGDILMSAPGDSQSQFQLNSAIRPTFMVHWHCTRVERCKTESDELAVLKGVAIQEEGWARAQITVNLSMTSYILKRRSNQNLHRVITSRLGWWWGTSSGKFQNSLSHGSTVSLCGQPPEDRTLKVTFRNRLKFIGYNSAWTLEGEILYRRVCQGSGLPARQLPTQSWVRNVLVIFRDCAAWPPLRSSSHMRLRITEIKKRKRKEKIEEG